MARRRRGQPVHGWVILDKPGGVSSAQAVATVRRVYDAAKAGHAGTLDPLATGVLPVALGEATKTVPYVMDATKDYEFTIHWGEARSTDDREGAVTATSDTRPDADAIRAALPRFIGEIQQVPPIYSAVKVDGERAYDLARSGEEVDLEPRRGFTDKEDLIHASRHDGGRLHRAGGRLLEVPLVTRDGAIGEPAPHAQRRRSRERRQSEPRCEVGLRSPALSSARRLLAAAAASH